MTRHRTQTLQANLFGKPEHPHKVKSSEIGRSLLYNPPVPQPDGSFLVARTEYHPDRG